MHDENREAHRLRTLQQLDVLSHLSDPALERIARLAAALTGTPGAGIHILDGQTQHRIAAVGVELEAWPQPDTFCRLAVESDQAVSTADATLDDRFAHSSFVDGPDPIRYYAAEPLRVGNDGPLGTLCVWDTESRPEAELDARLADLAAMVVEHLEQTRLLRLLAEQASTDSLTGLPNRRLLVDLLTNAIDALGEGGAPVAVALLDLDGFKEINDRMGHHTGDEVLRIIGRRLTSDLEDTDSVCARLGGDEFVVVHLGPPERARPVVRTVIERIEQPMEVGGEHICVAASVGVAMARPDESADAVLRRADHEMYERKLKARQQRTS